MIRPAPSPRVAPGPLLLRDIADGPSQEAHRNRHGALPRVDLATLVGLVEDAQVRGRGGAGFPLARKLTTAGRSGRRPVVVINAAEGEPASAKDSALLLRAPHLVLDGAVLAARALGAREVHVVTASDRPLSATSIDRAVAERRSSDGIRWRRVHAAARFVSGQAQAVLDRMAGRTGLPVTAWAPEAVRGHRGRPTLLANAETFAHLATLVLRGPQVYAAWGTPVEPGTTLLTIAEPPDRTGAMPAPLVVEVGYGAPFASALDEASLGGPVLLGGFHGTWAPPGALTTLPVSRLALGDVGLTLGAGVVIPLKDRSCPVSLTALLVRYLASESAGRCGPCHRGLPTLATEVAHLAQRRDTRARIGELVSLVDGRGACAHPDGTARLVRSLLAHLDEEVEDHLVGGCTCVRSEVMAG